MKDPRICGTSEEWLVSVPTVDALWRDTARHMTDMQKVIDQQYARIAVLEAGILAVDELISSSQGVDSLHLNGDVALWEDLLPGGRYGTWLLDFQVAVEAITRRV